MKTNRTTRFTGILAAVLMTVVTHGSVLWSFNGAAQDALWAHSDQRPVEVALNSGAAVASRG